MKLQWGQVIEKHGIGFGYTNHQKQLRAAVELAGHEITNDAEIAVQIVPAGNYRRIPGKFNVLYTMYETTQIPKGWIDPVNDADLIIVPCSHNKKLFERYTDRPVEVVLEGVEIDKFQYVEREFPTDKPFRYLWFGASNERKGYKHMVVAWHEFMCAYPELHDKVELYLKTTQNSENQERIIGFENGKPVKKVQPQERIFRADNAIFDSRKLPVLKDENLPGLVEIYNSAHCFVFPTMGEGFGLTLAEAMSTGLPCIYTPWSGPVDFCSAKEGYPVKFGFTEITAYTPQSDGTFREDLKADAANPKIESIVRKMLNVYHGYDKALEKGKRASERIRKEITWDISANSFIDTIKKYVGEAA